MIKKSSFLSCSYNNLLVKLNPADQHGVKKGRAHTEREQWQRGWQQLQRQEEQELRKL